MRQAGIFDPPGPQPGSQAVFLKDFTARFHETMRRAGVAPRDPLHPVLTMLGEMLVHFTHLQADHTGVANRAGEHLARRLQEEGARVQATVAEQGREIARTVGQGAGRVEAAAAEVRKGREDVQRGFRADTDALLRDAITKYASIRSWRETLAMAVLTFGLVGATGVAGFWIGQSRERRDMNLLIQANKDQLLAAAARDGRPAAEHWLRVMQWNQIERSKGACDKQPNGIGYRQVCSYVFWDSPPLDALPAPPQPR